jgi:hypothetical protein
VWISPFTFNEILIKILNVTNSVTTATLIFLCASKCSPIFTPQIKKHYSDMMETYFYQTAVRYRDNKYHHHHNHHQPINAPTAEAQAFLTDYPQGERAITHHAVPVRIGGS